MRKTIVRFHANLMVKDGLDYKIAIKRTAQALFVGQRSVRRVLSIWYNAQCKDVSVLEVPPFRILSFLVFNCLF